MWTNKSSSPCRLCMHASLSNPSLTARATAGVNLQQSLSLRERHWFTPLSHPFLFLRLHLFLGHHPSPYLFPCSQEIKNPGCEEDNRVRNFHPLRICSIYFETRWGGVVWFLRQKFSARKVISRNGGRKKTWAKLQIPNQEWLVF